MTGAQLKENVGGSRKSGFEILRAQVPEVESVLERGTSLVAQVQTALSLLAAGCRRRHITERVLLRIVASSLNVETLSIG